MDITLARIKKVIYDYLYKRYDDEIIHKEICDLYKDLFLKETNK